MKKLIKGAAIGAFALGSMSTMAYAQPTNMDAALNVNQGIVTTVATYRNGQLMTIEFTYEWVNGQM